MSIKTEILIRLLLYFFTITLCLRVNAADNDSERSVRLVLKVKKLGVNRLFRKLHFYNLTQYDQLTPYTHILDYNGSRRNTALRQTISKIKRQFREKILELEPTREYNDTLKPVAIDTVLYKSEPPYLIDTNLVCDQFYGMGIPEAWSSGYTGRGVTIAITDVGINTDLLDLKQNINRNLSYNFLDNNDNVIPEYFHNIRDKASYLTDHGNNMASIIGATKGNNVCSAGIAHNATVVDNEDGLLLSKVFKVTKTKSDTLGLHPRHWTSSDVFARALKFNLQSIDIFANAWAPVKLFDKLDIATNDVISYGASNGRSGLGTIHVEPSGPTGSQLSNNIDTITVSSIGRYGTVPRYTLTDASVLTSGLGDGNNLTSSMVTTTLNNRCITGFNGVSAATAQVSAIIGLGLQANKNLSLRDVQHLLVDSSEHSQLRERIAFTKNAAGRHFHGVFGFGLLNAKTFVENALKHRQVSKMCKKTLKSVITRTPQRHTQTFEFCYECKLSDRSKCLTVLEHVVLEIDIELTVQADIKTAIISPGGTMSVLMDFKPEQDEPIAVKKVRLVSVHFWGEKAFGKWQLLVQDKHLTSNIWLTNLSLELYGTAATDVPEAYQQSSYVCSSNIRRNTEYSGSKIVTTKSTKSYDVVQYKDISSDIDTITRYLPLSFAISIMIISALCGVYYCHKGK